MAKKRGVAFQSYSIESGSSLIKELTPGNVKKNYSVNCV